MRSLLDQRLMPMSFLSGQNLQVNGGLTLRRNPRSHEIDASVAAAVAKLEGN